MRQILWGITLALLAVPAVLTVAATPEPVAAPLADTQVLSQSLPAPTDTVDLGEACSAPDSENAAAAFCPFGSPTCVVHDDCDDYCGSPEFGYCEIQGFFPTGCCLCLG